MLFEFKILKFVTQHKINRLRGEEIVKYLTKIFICVLVGFPTVFQCYFYSSIKVSVSKLFIKGYMRIYKVNMYENI